MITANLRGPVGQGYDQSIEVEHGNLLNREQNKAQPGKLCKSSTLASVDLLHPTMYAYEIDKCNVGSKEKKKSAPHLLSVPYPRNALLYLSSATSRYRRS